MSIVVEWSCDFVVFGCEMIWENVLFVMVSEKNMNFVKENLIYVIYG